LQQGGENIANLGFNAALSGRAIMKWSRISRNSHQ